ncbi:DEKNAAC103281 [Brettanomyces naardenensis]|uniref:DEKNAAC103281 n=1 Tax=Brettanomyces naardenensis TaxID=13370 RepID=A0A448YMV2_BRENA|nr:DEKNAAC103281 [Brettanomyces naardenensis]
MKCMNKEPYMLINYSELMVSIIGSLTNKFFDSFSIKSFVFLVLVVVGVYAWNFSCGYVRAKSFYGLPLGEDYGGGRSGDHWRAGGSGHREDGNGEDLRGSYIGGSGRNYNGGISGSGRDYSGSSGKELTKMD